MTFAIHEGAGSRIRTDDLLITNQLLYQLSYAGKIRAQSTVITKGNKLSPPLRLASVFLSQN